MTGPRCNCMEPGEFSEHAPDCALVQAPTVPPTDAERAAVDSAEREGLAVWCDKRSGTHEAYESAFAIHNFRRIAALLRVPAGGGEKDTVKDHTIPSAASVTLPWPNVWQGPSPRCTITGHECGSDTWPDPIPYPKCWCQWVWGQRRPNDSQPALPPNAEWGVRDRLGTVVGVWHDRKNAERLVTDMIGTGAAIGYPPYRLCRIIDEG